MEAMLVSVMKELGNTLILDRDFQLSWTSKPTDNFLDYDK